MMNAKHGIILFAHGSRDALWAEPFTRLAALVAARCPQSQVKIAYLELMTPALAACVAELLADDIDDITIVPAFMARGGHLRRDLPLLVDNLRLQYPAAQLTLTPALGETNAILGAMADWIAEQAPLR